MGRMGDISMIELIFHHDHAQLPPASETILPVQFYDHSGKGRGDIAIIGSPKKIVDKIKRLGVQVSAQVIDFLSIALAVTAADTFVQRENSPDGWTRQLLIHLPLHEPGRWEPLKEKLQKTLHFLSGDMWTFEFTANGFPPPVPYQQNKRFKLFKLKGKDCVCLFSGGLDSAIGTIDLLANDYSPLLVSHAYTGDQTYQDKVAELLTGNYSRLILNAHPVSSNKKTDVSMRTRSFNFLAFGALGACALQAINQLGQVDLFIPENGFISLNAPLTTRRLGTLSTRTTHPHFIESMQEIFNRADMPYTIRNPYQFKTKGEMIVECQNRQLLEKIVHQTVSCSNWKRKSQQCGVCVPCLIRRSALFSANLQEETKYMFNKVAGVLNNENKRDDLIALSIAIKQKDSRDLGTWIIDSGPIPIDQFPKFKQIFSRGLDEVKTYLETCDVL